MNAEEWLSQVSPSVWMVLMNAEEWLSQVSPSDSWEPQLHRQNMGKGDDEQDYGHQWGSEEDALIPVDWKVTHGVSSPLLLIPGANLPSLLEGGQRKS
jgi:hypothetical protein